MTTANSNFDEILSTTLNNYVPKLTDNVFSARPLFYALTNGQSIRRISGGAKIVVPIIHGTNDTVGSYTGDGTIPTTAQTGISAAEYDWKQYAASVTITGIEEAKNNGEAQIIDLLEGKIFQAQESIIEGMNTMLWGTNGAHATDWLGLGDLVDSTGAVGGIDPAAASPADNAFWASSETDISAVAAGALTTAHMATMYNNVSVGNDQPSIIITTQAAYEAYENLLTDQIRYTDTDVADAGFQNLLFKGAPITFDDQCTAGEMLFLNTKYLRLVGHSDVWFKATPFVRPTNKDAVYSQILCYGNMTISNRARQGKITGIAS